jgi:hypothetical protein
MASDEEIEFASLFAPARYAKETKATQRMQAERRAAQTDKQHSRDGRARSVQVNFRSTPAFKALAAGLAKHLDLSVADMLEEAVKVLAKSKKYGGDHA